MGQMTLTDAGRAKWMAAQAAGDTVAITQVRFGAGQSAAPAALTALVAPFVPAQALDLAAAHLEGLNLALRYLDDRDAQAYIATEAGIYAEYPAGEEVLLLYESVPAGQTVYQKIAQQDAYYLAYYTIATAAEGQTYSFQATAALDATAARAGIMRFATQAEATANAAVAAALAPGITFSGKSLQDGAVDCFAATDNLGGQYAVHSVQLGSATAPAAISADAPYLLRAVSVGAAGADGHQVGLQALAAASDLNFPLALLIAGDGLTGQTGAVANLRLCGLARGFIDALRLHPASAGAGDRYAAGDRFYLKSNAHLSPTEPFQKTPTRHPAGRVIDAANAASGRYDIYLDFLGEGDAPQNAFYQTYSDHHQLTYKGQHQFNFPGAIGLRAIVGGGGGQRAAGNAAGQASSITGPKVNITAPGGAAGQAGQWASVEVSDIAYGSVYQWTVGGGGGGGGEITAEQAGINGFVAILPLYPTD